MYEPGTKTLRSYVVFEKRQSGPTAVQGDYGRDGVMVFYGGGFVRYPIQLLM
jgi:hypothetical protein